MDKEIRETLLVSPPEVKEGFFHVPGDLRYFAPEGMGGGGAYAYQERSAHPFLGGPRMVAAGGNVFFDSTNVAQSDFEAMLRVLEVQGDETLYAVFLEAAKNPLEEGYLLQMRLVSQTALTYLYVGNSEKNYQTNQPMPLAKALWFFMEAQKNYWGIWRNPKLEGLFGGNGDDVEEHLSFGFLIESNFNAIYRIWSRAWLVTK